jgi:DNA end-binding protein Ku
VLWTLRYGDEVRDSAGYFANVKPEKPEPQLVSLIAELIDKKTVPWDAAMLGDPVQAQLLELIAAKKKGKRPAKAKAAAERPSNVVNIMDALRKSIAADEKRPKGR